MADYNPPPPFFSSPRPFKHQIQESAAAKAYNAEWKWLSSSEAKQRSAAAKAHALSEFKKRFPYANMSLFQVQVDFDESRKALGRVLFPNADGSWENPLIEGRKYWSPALTAALGVQQDGGFPAQLSPMQQNKSLPVPAIAFSATTGASVADLFNKEIEAFGYCILGAQANTRSSIIGTLGTARNTQTDFLVLVDDSIRTLTVSNEPVKYQNAIEATKVRLNFAVARGTLLLPARMIINTESVVGYNNNLRRATDDMKLGVNNQVNQGTKKAGLKLMAGGPSKVNPPNSHPSNPVHKQATEAQGLARPATKPATPQPDTVNTPATPPAPKPESVDSHHVNKTLIAVGALALVGLIIYAAS